MTKNFLVICLVVFTACNFKPGAGRNDASADKILQLKFNPAIGSTYDYDISNEADSKFEVNDNDMENVKKTNFTVSYYINKDTSNNFVISIRFKKIHIYSKENDQETEMDSKNAEGSINPIEKMLGQLTNAIINATITPAGEVKSITGYQEIANQYLSQITDADLNAKNAAQKQWKDLVENSLVKNNVEKLFKIFPDSAVHVGDSWPMISRDNAGINLASRSVYKFTSIDDGKAIIESTGPIASDSSNMMLMGYSLSPDLQGLQKGEYDIDINTGMLTKSKITSNIKGTLDVMGKEVPLEMNIKIKMERED